jgi:hypothetical protein
MGNMFLHGLVLPLAMSAGGVIIRLVAVGFLIAFFAVYVSDKLGAGDREHAVEKRLRSHGTFTDRVGDALLYVNPSRFGIATDAVGNVRSWPLTPDTRASIETAGNVSVTRGRNLAAKAIGGALVPGGVFVFGNAKDRVHDNRELYLIVEDPEWAYTLRLNPALGGDARRFAQSLNLAARHSDADQRD